MKRLQDQLQQDKDTLLSRNEQLLMQQEAIRAAAAAELEMAMKLIEQVPLSDVSQSRLESEQILRVDTNPEPLDEAATHPSELEKKEEIDGEEEEQDHPVISESNPSSISVSRMQEAIAMDKQFSSEGQMASKHNSFDASNPLEEPNDNPIRESDPFESPGDHQSPTSRVSMSVFPTKKEPTTLTPIPIVMNAQILEFERPPIRTKRPPAPPPVETYHPLSPAMQSSPMAFPSPSAYLQHYDDRPATPELSPLEISPPGIANSPANKRRSSEPVDYLTASQALEKQQRLSLRIQPVVAPDPTPPPGASQNYDLVTANSPYLASSFISPVDPTKRAITVRPLSMTPLSFSLSLE